jgi:predicted ArsR family transcriptional regulator
VTGDGRGHALDVTTIRAVAALDDDSRRSIYDYVVATGRPVTREEVAEGVGVSRKLAAFHLDKLVSLDLLVSHTDATTRRGIRGRRPKLYERSRRLLTVSLPPRRPHALAQMLVEAVTGVGPEESAAAAALRVAARHGLDLGHDVRRRARAGRLGTERALTLSEAALRETGYEPRRESPTTLRLCNCPYRPMATAAAELVCHMNHRFLAGFLDGLGTTNLQAHLVPRPDECCVELRG